ncbi:MAG TPA: D-hexose-6-phosphate mutarotase [Kiritimatiellia bacterium]|nr:D-hexose-6-phosphate mutarotase [Kiritimatiellia bacterium]HRU71053.1 D-hexose-6-phosphate mutarotase [Kiritimatiellia bacterium]
MNPTIEQLNQRFGAPGRLVFRPGIAGLPFVALASRYGACELSLYGAHVMSYRPLGHMPVLFMSEQSRMERGAPFRGGIPICWPWFGPAAEPGQPLHGFARITEWCVQASSYDSESTEITLALTDSEDTRRFWPHVFALSLRVALAQSLTLELTAENRDTRPFTYSQAFHPYLRVRQIMDVTVRGLEGATYRDRLSGLQGEQAGRLNIRGETDRVFTPRAPACVLHDPGIGRDITVAFQGTRRLVVWNPWIDKAHALSDFGDDEYTRMLCLEPANTDGDEITLAPGAKHTLSLAVQATLA